MSALAVFCSRPQPGTWGSALLRELSASVEVRPCGPRWAARDLTDVELADAWAVLELDTEPGCLARPTRSAGSGLPRAAWLVFTSRKPGLHRAIADEADLVFHAHPAWAKALEQPSAWLPLCADTDVFRPVVRERPHDVVFVGPDTWRADPAVRLARRMGLRFSLVTTPRREVKQRAARAYGTAKLVFHRHLDDALDVRVIEALAAGRVVVSDRRANGLDTLAEPEAHVLLYSDEGELEAILDRTLQDDPRREAMEREIERVPRERLAAKQRAAELLSALQAEFGSLPRPRTAPTSATPSGSRPATTIPEPSSPDSKRRALRWLVLAGDEPPAVWLASYAERLADHLRRRGDDALVLRLCRAKLAGGVPRAGLLDVSLGPLPPTVTEEHRMLLASARMQRIADEIARTHGPFDLLLAEPLLGALVAPPLAQRMGLPFVLALEDCEVSRRGNVLTRGQLYQAELEHWASAHATALLVPTSQAADGAREHYSTDAIVTGWPTSAPPTIEESELVRLSARLRLEPSSCLLRAPCLAPGAALALASTMASAGVSALIVGESGAHLTRHGEVELLSERVLAGCVLSALAKSCRRTIHVGRLDLGAADLAAPSRHLTVCERGESDAVLSALAGPVGATDIACFDPSSVDRLLRKLEAASAGAAETLASGRCP